MTKQIKDMRNLGPAMQRMLAEIDISTAADLEIVGAVEAYLRLKFVFDRRISLNALYAMEAALRDCDWRALDKTVKQRLKAQISGQPSRRE